MYIIDDTCEIHVLSSLKMPGAVGTIKDQTAIDAPVTEGGAPLTDQVQGSCYRSPLSPNAKKKIFLAQKASFVESKWQKKKSPPKKSPLNITDSGRLMPRVA